MVPADGPQNLRSRLENLWHLSLAKEHRRLVILFYGLAASMRSVCPDNQRTARCGVLTLTEYVLRSLIMLAILVSLNFKITLLTNSSRSGDWDSQRTSLEYTHITLYTSVRWAFLGYLLLPTFIIITKITVLSWLVFVARLHHKTVNPNHCVARFRC